MSLITMITTFFAPAGQGQEAGVAPRLSVSSAVEAPAREEAAEEPSPVAAESVLHQSIKYVGKYHLMVLHFPIAFLLAAMLMQWYGLITGRGDGTVAVLFWFGTLGAIAAAVLGWMYAYDSVYFGDDEQPTLAPMAGNGYGSYSCCGSPLEKATESKGIGLGVDNLRGTRCRRSTLRRQSRLWGRLS